MADVRVASRYVKSLIGLAVEQGALDAVHEDMQMFHRLTRENKAFALMLKSPIIRHEKKKAILDRIFAGKVHPLTLAIIEILTRKNREPLLPAIASEFHNAYNEYMGISKASITTTIPMDKGIRAAVEELVKKLSNKKLVEIDEKIDKDLIGGFILQVGDKQVDASIKNKLDKLKLKFSENPYIREF